MKRLKDILMRGLLAGLIVFGSYQATAMNWVSSLYSQAIQKASPYVNSNTLNVSSIIAAGGTLVAASRGQNRIAVLCGIVSLATGVASYALEHAERNGVVLQGSEPQEKEHQQEFQLVSTDVQTSSQTNPMWESVPSGKVRVYHRIGRGGSLKSVREHGLLSYNELYKRGLSQEKPESSGLLIGHYDVIYAAWEPKTIANINSVGIDVDPATTYVYNREFRFDGCQGKYNGSKVLLATYIENRIKAEEMENRAKFGQAVIFDPYTSEPFYVSTSDKRYCDEEDEYSFGFGALQSRHYLYLNEIIFERDCIEPKELIFPRTSL